MPESKHPSELRKTSGSKRRATRDPRPLSKEPRLDNPPHGPVHEEYSYYHLEQDHPAISSYPCAGTCYSMTDHCLCPPPPPPHTTSSDYQDTWSVDHTSPYQWQDTMDNNNLTANTYIRQFEEAYMASYSNPGGLSPSKPLAVYSSTSTSPSYHPQLSPSKQSPASQAFSSPQEYPPSFTHPSYDYLQPGQILQLDRTEYDHPRMEEYKTVSTPHYSSPPPLFSMTSHPTPSSPSKLLSPLPIVYPSQSSPVRHKGETKCSPGAGWAEHHHEGHHGGHHEGHRAQDQHQYILVTKDNC